MSNHAPGREPGRHRREIHVAQWLWPAAAVGGALVVTVLSIMVGTGGGDEDPGVDGGRLADGPSATSATGPTGATGRTDSPPSASTTPSAGPQTAVPPASLVTVPVYYVMDVEGVGPRLCRELHQVPAQGGRVRTALIEMFAGSPRDPDYESLWPRSTRVLGAVAAGGTVTVDLSGFVSVGAAFEGAAVDELVHTVMAADPGVRQVTLRVNGKAPPSAHADWSRPVTRAAALDALADVCILAPGEGEAVTSPVALTVDGGGWVGDVPLKVFGGSQEVASTSVTTPVGGFAMAETALALPPGTYELRAYAESGPDGALQLWDTRSFTVR